MKLIYVGSKARSLGQILEKPCVHSRGNSFDPKLMKHYHLSIPIKSRLSLKLGHIGSKIRSLGQIIDKPCVHSRGHNLSKSS